MKKTLAIAALAATAALSMTPANAWWGWGGPGYGNGWNNFWNDFMGDGAFDFNFSARGHGWGRNHWRDYYNYYSYPYYGYGYPSYGYPFYSYPVAPPVAPAAPEAESK